jgi:hypothetical protein
VITLHAALAEEPDGEPGFRAPLRTRPVTGFTQVRQSRVSRRDLRGGDKRGKPDGTGGDGRQVLEGGEVPVGERRSIPLQRGGRAAERPTICGSTVSSGTAQSFEPGTRCGVPSGVWTLLFSGRGCELFGGLCVFVIERMFYWVGEAG